MKKKLFLLLLGLISIGMNVFSSEYQDERNVSDLVLIQNSDGKCYVLYKTDDSEVNMYVENHFDEEECGKRNFFSENTIKATSPFFKKEKYGREIICFTGTISETEIEEDNVFIFMSGADYTNFYSRVIPFPKEDNVALMDFTISDTEEITVYLSINDNLLSKTINPNSDSITEKYLFSGYKIEDIKIFKNMNLSGLYFGIFVSNNDLYAFVLNSENERIEKITESEKYYYLFDEKKSVCFFSDGISFKKFTFTDGIDVKELSIELDKDNIRDVFEIDNKINIISRDEENIYSIVTDENLQKFEKTIVCSNETTPFIYIEKNKFFNDMIVMIVKNIGVYAYLNNTWSLLEDYKNITPYINPKLSEISKSNEKNFGINIEINHKDGFFHYVAKVNNVKSIPLYENYDEDLDVIKNSSSINGLFYTFIKKAENINIISRMN